MKLNWNRFLDNIYSWEVRLDWVYSYTPRVRVTRNEKNGVNTRYDQLLETIWNMNFYDFQSARCLVRKYNQTHDDKYKISIERKI